MWQEAWPVVLAKVARWSYGVHYLRLDGCVPVLPNVMRHDSVVAAQLDRDRRAGRAAVDSAARA